MGEISEYYRTWEQDENTEPLKEEGDVWITGKGKRIELTKMTNLHIINTIRAWEGLGKTKPPKGWCGGKKKWLNLLTNELIRRQAPNKVIKSLTEKEKIKCKKKR